jgi:exonuclease SbcD
VLIVDAEPGKPASITPIDLTSGRRLRTVEGTLDQLRDLEVADAYLRVKLHESSRVGLGDEVRDLFPNTVKVEIIAPADDPKIVGQRDVAASPHDLFVTYLNEKKVDDPALVKLFDDLYEEMDATQEA